MDKVFISDLAARGIIGVHDWEREKPQEILINLSCTVISVEPGKTMTSGRVSIIERWPRKC